MTRKKDWADCCDKHDNYDRKADGTVIPYGFLENGIHTIILLRCNVCKTEHQYFVEDDGNARYIPKKGN